MPKFYRVMSAAEWVQVQSAQRIEASGADWDPYPVGAVVFLFVEATEERRFKECADDMRSRGHAPPVLISFEGSDSFRVEEDRSGWGAIGGAVHHGPIDEADTLNGFCFVRLL